MRGERTAAGRDAQSPARWLKQEPWARSDTPAGAKAVAEVARTRRPAAEAAATRIVTMEASAAGVKWETDVAGS